MQFIKDELKELEDKALFRKMKTVNGAQGKISLIEGEKYLSFCSNNYLDLANHPDVKAAVINAVDKFGWGSGASRLVSGNMSMHEAIENKIAKFKEKESAIVFPTGYMANVGTISSLTGKGDLVISDRLNHASIIDGCRLSQAEFRVYPHSNMEKLEKILKAGNSYRRKLIVTDTVFSMDGDLALMEQITTLAKKYEAMTMGDEAHATGVFGQNRRGALEFLGLEDEVDVVMGTLSKAIGGIGGFVCGSRDLIDYLRNKAKSFIYTTAMPPSVCAASIAGIELIEQKPELAQSLWRNINYLRAILTKQNVNVCNSQGPIVPIIIGDAEKAVKLANILYNNKILVPAIRPPTVPKGSSRLRVTLMSSHTKADIDRLVNMLAMEIE